MNRLFYIVLCLQILTACTRIVSQQAPPESEIGPAYITGSHQTGPVSIRISTTIKEWNVTASQPYDIIEERIVQTKQQVERYVFTPYATLPGLLQCTGGGIAALFSLGKAGLELLEYGCPRIVMLEKLKGTAFKPVEARRISQTRTVETPLTGAIIRLVDDNNEIQWEGVLSRQGTENIPYRALMPNTNQDRLILRIVSNGITVGERPLPLPVTKQDPEYAHIPWPIPTIFAIDSEHAAIRAALIHAIGQTGYIVIPGESEQHALEQESMLALNGRLTTNQFQSTSLKQTAATVLVQARPITRDETHVQLRFLDVKTGKELITKLWKEGERLEIDRK